MRKRLNQTNLRACAVYDVDSPVGRHRQRVLLWLVMAMALMLLGCQPPEVADTKPKDKRGIFGKKTQDVGEFDANAGRTIDDGKIDEAQLATPLIGGAAGYGPAAQQVAKLGVEKSIQLFHALNDRYPKDHAEFMEKIIRANDLRLPVLPGGREYQYDVENHTLVVVEPIASDKAAESEAP